MMQSNQTAAESLVQQKKNLRKQMRQMRRTIPAAEKQQIETSIRTRLFASEQYRHAEVLLVYLSVGDELDTWDILRQAWTDGKITAVPRCEAEHQMRFYEITDTSALRSGAYDIPEPDDTCPETVLTGKRVLCLVPGLAFDRSGGRMGYGGGYYDRFLEKHPDICTIGMAAECLLVEAVPSEETDQRLCGVITEKRLEVRNGR